MRVFHSFVTEKGRRRFSREERPVPYPALREKERHDQDQEQRLAQHPAEAGEESRRQAQQPIRVHQVERENPLGLDPPGSQ